MKNDEIIDILSDQWNTSKWILRNYLKAIKYNKKTLIPHLIVKNYGFVIIRFDQKKLMLCGLYVKPEFRNNGYGSLLIKEAQEYCLKRYYSVLYLETVDKVEFYKKRGWKECGERIFPASGNKLTLMKFSLKDL
jgi:GNAT superfamily N-acetyltransferase